MGGCELGMPPAPRHTFLAYLGPHDLLHAQQPASPLVLRDADPFRVFHRDALQRPVARNFQRELQLVLVDVVRRRHFVDCARHFDREVFCAQFFNAFGAFDVSEFGVDYDGGEVRRGVGCDGCG